MYPIVNRSGFRIFTAIILLSVFGREAGKEVELSLVNRLIGNNPNLRDGLGHRNSLGMAAMKILQPQPTSFEPGYRDLFEGHPLPMWVYDCETLRFLAVNDAAIRTYGYARDEFLGMRIPAIESNAGPSAGLPSDSKQANGHAIQHRRKDGSFINVYLLRYSTVFEDRPAIAVISSEFSSREPIAEHSDRKNQGVEHSVRDRTAQLEAMNRELEAFCYSVSHDLRAPLRSIRGFSEVLLERYGSKVDARGQELLQRVCESSQIMDQLIEDLLKLSRITRVEIQRQPVNISALAESIVQELREADSSRVVEVVIEPGLKAEGDERLLHVVLDNLLRNAWKFTGKQANAHIEVGVIPTPDYAFFIRDNGAGFDMTYAEKLFGVFQRLHSPDAFPGTGVGLAIVQRIVSRHGGRTWATGEVDKGATFYFTLPSS
jgi:PAS domain S-box-containing protein